MDRERYVRVRECFHAAVDLEGPRREEFLGRVCAGDAELRREVESLLDARERATPFLEPERVPAADRSPLIGKVVGRCEIVREIAEGGMGTVYEAVQQEPRRRVALKVLRSSAVGRDALTRFRHEAQALGRLAHPCIAQVHEAGTHDDGTGSIAYFTMELVADAVSLTRYASARRLSVPERLVLFVRVCEAVDYAHRNGVVHRDLKPSNVVVDAGGNPKVLDFGLAKITDADLALTTMRTQTGQLLGTIAYMSPEQVTADAGEVDPRCDVYALGVILYELLAGRLPIDTASKPLPEALRSVCEDDPEPLGAVDRAFQGDLETVAAKALEKDRERRYASVADLSADVGRVLRHEPISARPPSTFDTVRKFARRHRGLVAGSAAAVSALVVGLAVAISQAVSATRARDDLALEQKRSELGQYVANIAAAGAALRTGDAVLAAAFLEAAPPNLRDWEWWELEGRVDQSELTLTEATTSVTSIALSRDGSLMVAAAGGIRGFDTKDWRRIWSLEPDGLPVSLVALSRDGGRLLAAGENTIRTWKVDPVGAPRLSGRLELETAESCAAAFVGEPPAVWIAVRSGEIESWDGERTTPLPWRPPGDVNWLEPSADGRHVAVCTSTGAHVVDATGVLVGSLPGPARAVHAAAFSPDGRLLAESDSDQRVRLWKLETGRPVQELRSLSGSGADITSLCFSPDGTRVVSSSADHGVRVLGVDEESPSIVLAGHRAVVHAVRALPDGRIASGSEDRTIKIWAPDRLPPRSLPGSSAVFAPDGAIYTLREDRRCRLRSGATSAELLPRAGLHDELGPSALGRAGRILVPSVNQRGRVQLFHLEDGTECDDGCSGLEREWDGTSDVAFSPDGRRVARPRSDGRCDLVDTADGRVLAAWTDPGTVAPHPVFSPDGTRLATISTGGDVILRDGFSCAPVLVLEGHGSDARCVAFAPDGRTVATGSIDRTARIWDASTGQTSRVLRGHAAQVETLAFSPSGARLATGGFDGTVRLWDVASGREVATLRANADEIYAVRFGPDGACLLAASHGRRGVENRSVNLWHAGSEGRRLARSLQEELLLPGKIVARLEADASLAPSVRDDALRTARSLHPDAGSYNARAWALVGSVGADRSSCERALRLAEAACALDPANFCFLNTLGAAQYRCGRYGEALKVLEAAESIQPGFPPDLAFMVMCRARMGDLDGARGELARLEEFSTPEWRAGEPHALRIEARSVLAACSAPGASR